MQRIGNKHNNLHLARKHASRIFLLLFLEVHSFPHVKLWENCLLLRTDDVRGQNILAYFHTKQRLIECLYAVIIITTICYECI